MARALLVALALCSCAPREGKLVDLPKHRPSAEDVVANMVAVYASAQTYEDHGNVTTDRTFHRRLTFRTAFVRGEHFRFEYDNEGDPAKPFVIWSDGTHTYSRWYIKAGSTDDSNNLNLALGAAAGVSSLTSVTVPTMLLPDTVTWFRMEDLVGPTLVEDEMIGGHRCWHVVANHPRGGSVDLWIDQESHLLRRHAFLHAIRDYEPKLDEPISSAALEPPAHDDAEVRTSSHPSWLGVRPDPKSTRLTQIVSGSPADRAGLHVDDIVISIDGHSVTSGHDIVARARAMDAGRTVPVIVMRDGKPLTLTVTTEPMPDATGMVQTSLNGKPAPDFAVDNIAGGTLALHDFKGKVVVLEFWATWCGPCKFTAPELSAWHKKYPDIEVIGISDEDLPTIMKAIGERKLDYTMARDGDDKAWNAYLVQALPTMFVIDKAGVVRYAGVGAGDFDTIEALIKKLR